MKRLLSLILLLIPLVGLTQAPRAYETKKTEVLWHDQLQTDSLRELKVNHLTVNNPPTIASWSPPYSVGIQNLVSSNGLIILSIDHDHYEDADKNLDYTFTIEVSTFDLGLIKAVDTIQLSVNNRPASPNIKTISKDARVYNDIVYMQFKVLSIMDNLSSTSITDPKNNLALTGEIELERYLDFTPTANCSANWSVDTLFVYKPKTESLSISQPGACDDWLDALEWEIEWTYVDNFDLDATNSNRLPDSLLNYDFNKNATRVRLPIGTESYTISNVFEEGHVLVRVRKVGRRGAQFNQIFEGDWFPATSEGLVSAYPTWAQLHIDNVNIPSHEGGEKTWQYVASYAEEGKNKEVVSYYDGLNKNRQAATRLSTENVTVVGESIYDYQGRPAVQILPVPINDKGKLRYYDSLNITKDAGSIHVYRAGDFDGEPTAKTLDSQYNGAAQYYSGENNMNSVHKDYIPNARGYPFTQTVFMDDGTGRVLYQSGVGPDHKIGSGHEIEYQYAKPEQQMLDALFGTEAGYQQHYKESMVIDANGQMSVSYIDQHGRVIATSLAGDNPDNLDKLDSQIPVDSADFLRRNLMGGNGLRIPSARPYAYELNYPYFSKGEAAHKFWYEFQPEQLTLSCNSICLDCVYDLTITISNDTGLALFDTVLTVGPLNNYDKSCSESSKLTLWTGDSVDNSAFSLTLPVGKYRIYKRLEINKSAEDAYWEMYFNDSNACFIPLDSFIADAYQYVVDCDSILPGLIPENLSDFARSMYNALLQDVSPGGQYAAYDLDGAYFGPGGSLTLAQYESRYKLVSVMNDTSILGASYWRIPLSPYKDDQGDIDSIFDPSTRSRVRPEQVSDFETFIKEWKPSWALSLVPLHPEYPYYELSQQYDTAFKWDDAIRKISTYAQAEADSLVLQSDHDIILSKDPFYSFMVDSAAQLGTNAIAATRMIKLINEALEHSELNYSLKQLAAVTECLQYTGDTVVCKNVNNFGDAALGATRLDAQWMAYRNIYLGKKRDIVDYVLKDKAANRRAGLSYYLRDSMIQSDSFAFRDTIRFANRYGLDVTKSHTKLLNNKKHRYVLVNDMIGFDNFDTDEDRLKLNANAWMNEKLDEHCSLQCSSYVSSWRKSLIRCNTTAVKMDSIIAGFLEVCALGCDADYPLGTSSLPIGDTTESGYTSFKDVLQTLLGTTLASGNYCNDLLIDVPQPYQHNIGPDGSLNNESTDMECACDLLAQKVSEYQNITVHQDTCNQSLSSKKRYVTHNHRLVDFLNNLQDSAKLSTNTAAFSLTNYPGFDTLKVLLKSPNTAHSASVKLEDVHGFSKLVVSIWADNDSTERYGIELYGYKEGFGTAFGGLVFSDYSYARSFRLNGAITKGFGIKAELSTTTKTLSGRSFGFAVPKNGAVISHDRCEKRNTNSGIVLKEFLAFADLGITEDELKAWQMACDGIRALYRADTTFYPAGSRSPLELGDSYFQPDIINHELYLVEWLNEVAGHDKDSSGNAYGGAFSEDFGMASGDEYGYQMTGEVFNFLPDSFGTFYQNLEGYYNIYDNIRLVNLDSIKGRCVLGTNKFKNNIAINEIIWGAYIGADLDPRKDLTYVALGHIETDKRQYYRVYSGSFVVNDIDSIKNYRYDRFLDRYLVDCYVDVAGGHWTTLVFYNEYQEYACTDECETIRHDWVPRPGNDYSTTCQLNQCRLIAMQDFLDHLASQSKLNGTTNTDVDNYPGYHDADLAKSLKYYRRKVPFANHQYKALFDPDASTYKKDTLRAVIGIDTTSPVYITLVKTASLNWGAIDSFYGIMLDTGKWVDNYIAKADPQGAGYYFTLKGFDAAGTTEVVIRGYTNTFFFGTCNVSTVLDREASLKVINEQYSAAVPPVVRKKCPDCLDCKEIYEATKDFYTLYPNLGHNHMHHNQMLATYLNREFNNNLFPTEYIEFIEQCEMTDSLLLRRNTCGYSFTVNSAGASAALSSITALNTDLDTLGQRISYQRDSLSDGSDSYCFDLSSIGDSLYLTVLAELQTIATGGNYSGQSIDPLDAHDYYIQLKQHPYTGACRAKIGSLLADTLTSLYATLSYDSVTVHRHSQYQLAAVPYTRFRIEFGSTTEKNTVAIMQRLRDSLNTCVEVSTFGNTLEALSKWEQQDTICPTSFATGTKSCTSCESIRQSMLKLSSDTLFAFDQPYDVILEDHLEYDLQKSFSVQRVEGDGCFTCADKKVMVCEETSAQAAQLEVFLNAQAVAGKLVVGDTLNTRTEFYQTILHINPAPVGNVIYNPTSHSNDSLSFIITDNQGFSSYVLLYAQVDDAFNFNTVTKLANIRVLPNKKGRNSWFVIDAYDDAHDKWHPVTGYASRYTITRCCEFVENKLCFKPYFREIRVQPTNCDSLRENMARLSAFARYDRYMELQESNFKEVYRQTCAGAFNSERFDMKYPQLQHHFTLYYYDIAGNLVRTVPPEGVQLNTGIDTNKTGAWREKDYTTALTDYNDNAANFQLTSHSLSTYYQYNTLNEVTRQLTPDGGESGFYYDRLGRLVFSQNARQAEEGNVYSYTRYDGLGRISEVGEMALPTSIWRDSLKNDTGYFDSLYTLGVRSEMTLTRYDSPLNTDANNEFGTEGQTYLRNRVAATYYIEDEGVAYSYASHYSYDVHGNVKTVIHEYAELEQFAQRYKRIDYDYDLVSGNVNMVRYQEGQPDQFYHKYEYDADNRITSALTSKDQVLWEEDARYEYYLHGPLARVILGEDQVQGIDYAYTLHGWLKGVNGELLDKTRDIGKDGHDNPQVARDAFGFSLGYYDGDYRGIDANNFIAQRGTTGFGGSTVNKDLYNGNISHMATANRAMFDGGKGVLGMNYTYDQLNRIKSSESFIKTSNDNNTWAGVNAANLYSTGYTYDGNGNIESLYRYGYRDVDTLMDSLQYHYYSNSNQLKYVADLAGNDHLFSTQNGGVEDINSGQDAMGNYRYDAIGNLVKDKQEGIRNIDWTVYGKVRRVERADTVGTPDMEFKYDASGNRIVKIVKPISNPITWKYTYYARDAQGNVMAVYNLQNGLKDSSFSDSIITSYLIDSFGLTDVGTMFNQYYKNNAAFVSGLIDELETSNRDTVVMNEYTLAQILGWDNSLATDLLNAYAHSTDNFDDIIDSLVNRHRNDVVDALTAGQSTDLMADVLDQDSNNDLLDCFSMTKLQAMHLAVFNGTPPAPGTKAAVISDLMGSTVRSELLTELSVTHSDSTIDHLKNCIDTALLLSALKDGPDLTESTILLDVSAQISAADLTTFFTTSGDRKANRPFNLLKQYGTHSYILNMLATEDADEFIENSIKQNRAVIDNLLQDLSWFTTSAYLTVIQQYHGQSEVNDLINILGTQLMFYQHMRLAEHNLYGSSRLGIRAHDQDLYKTEFTASGVDTTTGAFVKDSIYLSDTAVVDTINLNRTLGWKSYELSNHLGNVLVTLGDQRVYVEDTSIISGTDTIHYALWDAHIKSAQDYYPFGMMMPNRVYSDTQLTEVIAYTVKTVESIVYEDDFSTSNDIGKWSDGNSTMTHDSVNERMKVENDDQWDGTSFTQNTTAGKKYRIELDLTYGTCSDIRLLIRGIEPGSYTHFDQASAAEGHLEYSFTGTGSKTIIYLQRAAGTWQGNLDFYVDNFRLVEITDTLYQDTTYVATGNGYRYAFNGMERDDEWNGVGNINFTEYRILDTRLGRWLSIDPLASQFPWQSPYVSMDNNPISLTDVSGLSTENNPPDNITTPDNGTVQISDNAKVGITFSDGEVYTFTENGQDYMYHFKEKWYFTVVYDEKSGEAINSPYDPVQYAGQSDLSHDYPRFVEAAKTRMEEMKDAGESSVFLYTSTRSSGERGVGIGSYSPEGFMTIHVGETFFASDYPEVGGGESVIPVWGSGKQAYYDFQDGYYWSGLGNTAIAVSDVFLVKSIATGIYKGGLRAMTLGNSNWGTYRRMYGNRGFARSGQHVHHWMFERNRGIGRRMPNWFKNQMWNLKPVSSATINGSRYSSRWVHLSGIHGGTSSRLRFTSIQKMYYATPSWVPAFGISVGGRIIKQ